MSRITAQWNLGMLAAAFLLLAGAALMLTSDQDSRLNHAGFAVVIAALAVYLVSRVWMLTRERRQRP